MVREWSSYNGVLRIAGIAIYRWDDLMVGKQNQGIYCVVCTNLELYWMQLGSGFCKTNSAHPICVVDNFGNLVRVK